MFKKVLVAMVLGCFAVAATAAPAAAQTGKTTSTKKIDTLYKKANDLLGAKEYEDAMEVVDQILALDENQAHAWGIKAWLLNNDKNFKQGEKAAKRAVALDDTYAFAWYELGYARINQKKYEAAAEAFEKTIEVNPKHWLAYDSLAIALRNLDREDEADKWVSVKKKRMAKDKALAVKDDAND